MIVIGILDTLHQRMVSLLYKWDDRWNCTS